MFAWALTSFASVYCGMARRATDLAVAAIKQKTSLAVSRSSASAISARACCTSE
jgi:hypothetical protein